MSTAFPQPGQPDRENFNSQQGQYNPQQQGQYNPQQQGQYNPQQQGQYYGQPVPPAPQPTKKRGGCLKWAAIIAAILLILMIIAGMGDSESGQSTNSGATDAVEVPEAAQEEVQEEAPDEEMQQEEAPQPEEAPAPASDGGDLAIGETADLKGFNVTVESFWNEGADYFGTNHVCANVAIVNNSDKAVDVNQFDFELTTPAGITVDSTFTGSSNFQTAKVNPGGQMGGIICFESDAVPGEFKLAYEPLFSTRSATWSAQL